MPHTIRTLQLRLPTIPLRPHDVPRFRAAMCESAGMDNDIFHNHSPGAEDTEAVLHRPALIHYRVSKGCACVWGMGEGANALERWWLSAPEVLRMGGFDYPLHTAEVHRENFQLDQLPTGEWKYYRVHDYLALHSEYYAQWLAELTLVSRAQLLERAIAAHLLAFCRAADWRLPERLEVQLVDIHDRRKTTYHGTSLMKMDLTYRCNLVLPENMALGKAVSHGYGVQWYATRFEEVPANRRSHKKADQLLIARV